MIERHPSTLRFDALAHGAVDDAERAALDAHLAGCARCRALRQEGAADRERFTRFVFPRTVDAVRTAPSPLAWGRVVWLFAPAVVLLAVIVGMKWPDWRAGSQRIVEPSVPAAGPVLRESDVRLQVFALAASRRGEVPTSVRELGEGGGVHAGELLGFRLWSFTQQEFCMLVIYGNGRVEMLNSDDHSERVIHGYSEHPATLLVEPPFAPARVFALFSPQIIPQDRIRAEVKRLHLDAATVRTMTRLPLPPMIDGRRLPPIAQRSLLLEAAP